MVEATEPVATSATSPLAVAAIASAGAAVLHAAAAGIHADHVTLSRLFVALAVAQAAVAIMGFVRAGSVAAIALVAVNAVALSAWVTTRLVGVSWIEGLQVAERPQLADTSAAVLALVAVVAASATLWSREASVPFSAVSNAALLTGVLLVPGLVATTTHDHGESTAAAVGDSPHQHDTGGAAEVPPIVATDTGDTHDHDDHEHDAPSATADEQIDEIEPTGQTDHTDGHDHQDATDVAATEASNPTWPWPWDPAGPIDFSGVAGVTAGQRARAEALVADTLRDLPAFADVTTVPALGYRSIGDASTGYEHYINTDLIADDVFLDPAAPESLVYEVDGDDRTLVSAMFIANETAIDDPELVDFGGPLMQWHVHQNLCWGLDDQGIPVVKAVTDDFAGTCPAGTVNAGGDNPMVHVWIAPHECGPFAALEGHGAGRADAESGSRTDQCGSGHDGHAGHDATVAAPATKPYDPALPIDLGGLDGVTLEQQAFAENLVAATVRDLPQWADPRDAEAAGFRSIGDAATGHEHYIQWDWIDDDVWLDPDYPESLVFQPGPNGTKQLVSAMFMLPSNYTLDQAPDDGGSLMQWHEHGDLCFTADPEAPQVAGLRPLGTRCQPPLVELATSPMIHVWIVPHECGPFAALDGIGGGQVPEGEEVLCDHAHGAH